MKPLTRAVLATAAISAAGGTAYGVARTRRFRGTAYGVAGTRRGGPATRSHVITVHRPLAEIADALPGPLAEAGGALDVRLQPAPGDRGTEIRVRPTGKGLSDGDIRRILRESRSLLEVGEVLRPGVATTTPTLLNRPLRAATRHGREGGLL